MKYIYSVLVSTLSILCLTLSLSANADSLKFEFSEPIFTGSALASPVMLGDSALALKRSESKNNVSCEFCSGLNQIQSTKVIALSPKKMIDGGSSGIVLAENLNNNKLFNRLFKTVPS